MKPKPKKRQPPPRRKLSPVVQDLGTLRCTGCGATAKAPCGCGVEFQYIPAGKAAAKAVAAHPEKSDRAIAADVGVSHKTVERARKSSGVTNVTPTKRTGRNGVEQAGTKQRKLPAKNGEHVNGLGANLPVIEVPEVSIDLNAHEREIQAAMGDLVGVINAHRDVFELVKIDAQTYQIKIKDAPKFHQTNERVLEVTH